MPLFTPSSLACFTLRDEHAWPITFSYALGGASGKQGMKAGLYFSSAFTFQRMLLSEASRLALAPFLLSRKVSSVIYVVVGIAISAAGAMVLKRHRYPHLHVVAHLGKETRAGDATRSPLQPAEPLFPCIGPLIHGFIAGFGFGGFSFFVNVVAAPAIRESLAGFSSRSPL